MKKWIVGIVVAAALLIVPLNMGTHVEGTFTQTSVKKVQVTASSLAMRTGAGTTHTVIRYLAKGSVVDVLGSIGKWYVVKTGSDSVGCINQAYVKTYTPSTVQQPAPQPTPTPQPQPQPAPAPVPAPTGNSLEMQKEMLSYVNAERAKENLAPLALDTSLSNGAYLKSKDMAENNYFSHTSPTYGSPFDMMKSLGITYRMAGENIAKHFSVKGAHDAFMNSSGHRANIMKAEYKKVGFGFVQEGSYLYVTQWFTD